MAAYSGRWKWTRCNVCGIVLVVAPGELKRCPHTALEWSVYGGCRGTKLIHYPPRGTMVSSSPSGS